ncbi:hypothetical protein MUK42_05345 [Musa troglodytarum]|uniref:Uncharacterized protein n=1 Tax=Musa troglodytarum TaxID=320322 RepID=A0A9E7EJW1_9LILI|nr:hypothetical protein MUK42_05345 [Musa troglodytarum]
MTTRITPGVGANLLGQHSAERNRDATTYVGNLDPHITELLWELFVQAGPVASNPGTRRIRPLTLFASGPPTLPNGPQANGSVPAAIPPGPFANGSIPPVPLPAVCPPPPPTVGQFPLMRSPAQSQPAMPSPPLQQFRPPPPPSGMGVLLPVL